MGCNILFSSSSGCTCELKQPKPKKCTCDNTPRIGEPVPHKFEIEWIEQLGDYCIVFVNYPNCTTFDGNKLLVFKDEKENIENRKILDPHFFKGNDSPIARFKPNEEGINMAASLIKNL